MGWAVVADDFNLGRGRQFSEFEASQVYRVSSGTARATQRNTIPKEILPQKKSNGLKRSKNREQWRKREQILEGGKMGSDGYREGSRGVHLWMRSLYAPGASEELGLVDSTLPRWQDRERVQEGRRTQG